jgi:hypothetical protein
MANVRVERLLKIPAEASPELRIPALQLKREYLGIRASFQRDNLRILKAAVGDWRPKRNQVSY